MLGQTDHMHIIKRTEFMASKGYIKKGQKIKQNKKRPLTVAGPSDGTQPAEQQPLALHAAAHPKHEGNPDAPQHSETCCLCSGL
jgi:hypothetical protein